MSPSTAGLLYALGAFGLWGLSPLYWRLLAHVPPFEILLHRVAWSALFLLWFARGKRAELRRAASSPRTVALLLGTTALIGLNWYLYIKAIADRRVLDTSLGYYINPLVNVALGVVVLRERMRPLQAGAAALALCGVGWLVHAHGELPLLSLTLAGTFALYALLRKVASVDALAGLSFETFVLTPPCLAGLAWLAVNGHLPPDARTWLLLAGGAGITAVPLLWFVEAAPRLDLKTMGFLQFTSPTLQFLIAVFAFAEPLPKERLTSFVLIWLGVALYCADAALKPKK
ncbi:MAG: EamA family transporter RarD [Elusimicrobiota bacterium]|nr:MAG: EamA family transporter RarD [Elusimicrobiota bacterium]